MIITGGMTFSGGFNLTGQAVYFYQPETFSTSTVLLLQADKSYFNDDVSIFNNIFAATAVTATSFVPSSFTSIGVQDGSAYFGSAGNLLSSTNLLGVGTGNFTIECWVYPTAAPNAGGTFILASAISGGFVFGYQNATTWGLAISGGAWFITSTTLPTLNAWNYLSVTRNSGTAYLFLNGSLLTSASSAQSFVDSATYIGHPTPANTINGYVSNLRIIHGRALYTSSFTTATQALTVTPTPLDISNYSLDIAASSYANVTSPLIAYGTADFTIECWFRLTNATSSFRNIWAQNSFQMVIRFGDSGFGDKLQFAIDQSSVATVWSCAVTASSVLNTWTHVAWTRSNGVNRLYVNGALQSIGSGANPVTYPSTSFTNASSIASPQTGRIGNLFVGQISNVRVTNGYVVYSGNFTPPTNRLTTTQSTGTNNIFPINSNSQQYSISVNGSTQYLTIPNSSALQFGTGDFTIEYWVYFTTTPGAASQFPLSKWSSNTGWELYYTGNGTRFAFYALAGTPVVFGTTVPVVGVWYHVAATRSSGTIRLFVNGIQEGTPVTGDTTNFNDTNTLYIGMENVATGIKFGGYVSNLRIINGSALYTSAFTPSTDRLQIIGSSVTYSYYFANAQYLTLATGAPINISNNPFTIEFWTYQSFAGYSNYPRLIEGNGVNTFQIYLSGTTLNISGNGGTIFLTANLASYANSWLHIAVSRSAGTMYLFLNGNLSSSVANSFSFVASTSMTIFAPNGGGPTGYLYNLRMVNGTGLYTTAFTPQKSPLGLVAGTTLLTAQSSSFVDNSVNAYAISIGGTGTSPSITSVTPQVFTTALLTAQDVVIQDNSSLAQTITNVGAATTSTLNPFGSTALLTAQDSVLQDNSSNAATLTTIGGPGVSPLTPFGVTTLLTLQSNAGIDNNTVENFARIQTTSTVISKVGTVTPGAFGPFNPSGWSNFFNAGDKLTFPSSSAFDLSGSTWTIEFWMYSLATPTSGNQCRLLMAGSNGDAAGWDIGYDNNGSFGWYRPYASPGTQISAPAGTIVLNTWYHIAVVCNAGSARIYVNGVSVAGPTAITLPSSASQALRIGYDDPGTVNFQYNGYISNLRIVQDRAIYTGNFTPPNSRFLTTQSAGTNIASIGSVKTTLDYSVLFNGTSQYLTTPSTANYNLSTGDWTVECWVYVTSNGNNSIFFVGAGGSSTWNGWQINTDRSMTWQTNPVGNWNWVNTYSSAVGQIPLNAWTHVAAVRYGSNFSMYVNGSSVYSTNSFNGAGTGGTVFIGTYYANVNNDGSYFRGRISNFRIVKGSAMYTANFAVPTDTLTAVAGTSLLILQSATFIDNSVNASTITPVNSPVINTLNPFGIGTTVLLTCQSNRFVDNSTNALALTVTGAPVIAPFSPLPPTDSYSPSVHGSSLYFSGTNSYLNFTQEPNLYQFAGDFTIEAWVYSLSATGQASYSGIFDTRATNSPSTTGIVVNLTPSGYLNFYINSNNYTSATLLGANNWTHVALVRSGSTISMYQNGVSVASVSYATSLSSGNFWVGTLAAAGATGFWQGYISDLRAVNGVAVYTSAFTPPTRPLSATAQTVVLLNGNSAGIIDSTGKNTITTVGGAKISQAVYKYGTGSLSFNGTTDYLTIPYGNFAFEFGSGNYTIELWLYALATTGSSTVFARGNPGSLGTDYFTLEFQGNQLQHYVGAYTTAAPICAAVGITWANTWHHVAVVRNVNTWTMYVDGVAQATTITGAYTITATTSPNPSYIATSTYSTSRYFSGYMDDIRISRIARYTANFTPPTAALSTGTYIQIG